jgi:hypothetical protein
MESGASARCSDLFTPSKPSRRGGRQSRESDPAQQLPAEHTRGFLSPPRPAGIVTAPPGCMIQGTKGIHAACFAATFL